MNILKNIQKHQFFSEILAPSYTFDKFSAQKCHTSQFTALFFQTKHFPNFLERNPSIYLYYNIVEVSWQNKASKKRSSFDVADPIISESRKAEDSHATQDGADQVSSSSTHTPCNELLPRKLISLILDISNNNEQSNFLYVNICEILEFFLSIRCICGRWLNSSLNNKYYPLFQIGFFNSTYLKRSDDEEFLLTDITPDMRDMKILCLKFHSTEPHKIPKSIRSDFAMFKLVTFRTVGKTRNVHSVFKYNSGHLTHLWNSFNRKYPHCTYTFDDVQNKLLIGSAIYELN